MSTKRHVYGAHDGWGLTFVNARESSSGCFFLAGCHAHGCVYVRKREPEPGLDVSHCPVHFWDDHRCSYFFRCDEVAGVCSWLSSVFYMAMTRLHTL